MNVAMGVRTPGAALLEVGRAGRRRTLLSRFLDALKKSRRREARLVIVRHAHLLPLDHPWRSGPVSWKS
jgi:hypothetical protein